MASARLGQRCLAASSHTEPQGPGWIPSTTKHPSFLWVPVLAAAGLAPGPKLAPISPLGRCSSVPSWSSYISPKLIFLYEPVTLTLCVFTPRAHFPPRSLPHGSPQNVTNSLLVLTLVDRHQRAWRLYSTEPWECPLMSHNVQMALPEDHFLSNSRAQQSGMWSQSQVIRVWISIRLPTRCIII